jgi:hypothetical protein
MAAFTALDHMDRGAFERRWSRLRADETVIATAIVVDDEVVGTIGSWGDPDEREVTYVERDAPKLLREPRHDLAPQVGVYERPVRNDDRGPVPASK